MKKTITIILLLASFNVYADKVAYVTDQIDALLRSGKGTKYKIIKLLPTGTYLKIIDADVQAGYTKVRLNNGVQGWILTRFVSAEPTARSQLKYTRKTLASLKIEHKQIKEELNVLKGNNKTTSIENDELNKEKTRLSSELETIRKTAADAIQIQRQSIQLQERVVNLERELQKVKRENQTLEDSSSQDWFLIGAGVLFAGILLGLIFPKISWRRKTSSWDSF